MALERVSLTMLIIYDTGGRTPRCSAILYALDLNVVGQVVDLLAVKDATFNGILEVDEEHDVAGYGCEVILVALPFKVLIRMTQ
jgi:hypothetical protein